MKPPSTGHPNAPLIKQSTSYWKRIMISLRPKVTISTGRFWASYPSRVVGWLKCFLSTLTETLNLWCSTAFNCWIDMFYGWWFRPQGWWWSTYYMFTMKWNWNKRTSDSFPAIIWWYCHHLCLFLESLKQLKVTSNSSWLSSAAMTRRFFKMSPHPFISELRDPTPSAVNYGRNMKKQHDKISSG